MPAPGCVAQIVEAALLDRFPDCTQGAYPVYAKLQRYIVLLAIGYSILIACLTEKGTIA